MNIFWDRFAVLFGSLLLIAAFFLPGIKEAILPEQSLSGWVIAAIGAAAVFEIGQDIMTNILASLFICNLLFISCTILYPFLKKGSLIVASRMCMVFMVYNFAITIFFFPNTHFAVGHYAWLIGMGLVTWGFYQKAKRAQVQE